MCPGGLPVSQCDACSGTSQQWDGLGGVGLFMVSKTNAEHRAGSATAIQAIAGPPN